VIKGRGSPRDRVMAGGTVGGRKRRSRRRVHRTIRLLPSRQVTLRISTIRRRDGKAVVVVDVARRAGWHLPTVGHQRVRIRQRETECAMVEFAVRPFCDWVTGRAGGRRGRKPGRDVVGNTSAECGSTVPSRQMAAHAVR
jgi:hypothetical protein